MAWLLGDTFPFTVDKVEFSKGPVYRYLATNVIMKAYILCSDLPKAIQTRVCVCT